MDIQRLNPRCISCLIDKYLGRYKEHTDEERIEYMQRLLEVLSKAPKTSGAPEIVDEIQKIEYEMFGFVEDFSEIKRYFNDLLLKFEDELFDELQKAGNPLRLAVCYAMTGNYIDFGAMPNVDEEKLKRLIDDSGKTNVDPAELLLLENDIKSAKKLVFLTDNCGEIVFDKQLIKIIKKINPDVYVDVIVRGFPVLNDATMDDALQVGLDKVADVSDNGSTIAGTCLDRISTKAREKIENADVIIAKGQGNFETLRFCGKNIYYIFMCKCEMFAERFDVPRYSGMLVNDLRMLKG